MDVIGTWEANQSTDARVTFQYIYVFSFNEDIYLNSFQWKNV